MTIQDRQEVNSLIQLNLLADKVTTIIAKLGQIQLGVKEITIKLKGVQIGETK